VQAGRLAAERAGSGTPAITERTVAGTIGALERARVHVVIARPQ
jgi:hypothetical protein